MAHPLETIQQTNRRRREITEIVRERKIDHVVAGVPAA